MGEGDLPQKRVLQMKTILVIEDERSIADTVVHSIEREGYRAEWRERGMDGLERLRRGDCALVVLDVGLPDVNGFELCRSIRAFSGVPIIFLTARDDEIDRIVGLEIGADDYVVKPFSPRELGARIKSVLRRVEGGTAAPEHKDSGPLVIDEAKMLAVYKGRKLELTRYEFGLLVLLAKNPGRVYSRDALMRAVWDDDTPSLDRTVDAHIKSLRAKFREVDASHDPIVTHRGAGYAFREDL